MVPFCYNPHTHLRKLALLSSSKIALHMASSLSLKSPTSFHALIPLPPSSSEHFFHTCTRLLPLLRAKPNSKIHPPVLNTNGFPRYVVSVPAEPEELNLSIGILKYRLEKMGIELDDFAPGQHNSLICPECKGGDSEEKSLSILISPDGSAASWNCFRGKCGWNGGIQAFAGRKSTYDKHFKRTTVKNLQPLCGELIGYFKQRLISQETLQRNAVMQKTVRNQDIIAFTYRQNNVRVGCKYRTIKKRFWQETGTEKWLYGVDDINGATEIIIVKGEIDKLSVEEAGFRNCVSVPCGAPQVVSAKDLPPSEKDRAFQYLWNCKEYLQNVSRIILATDGDASGQALAEELARRLGKERCWIVRWPKNDNSCYYKDANEVLTFLGPAALREVIETAQVYQQVVLNQYV